MAASDARPVPRKNAAWRYYFALRKPSDSTLITGWTGADSEVSLDGAAYSDCTNEATEIGTTGTGYIDLTAAEMNADAVMLKITITNTGAVPYVFTFYPEEAGDYRVDSSNSSVGSVSGAVGSVTAGVTLAASQPDYAPLLESSYTAPANSDIAAIKSKTDNLPSDPADQSLIIDATNAVMARLGAPAGASMSADIAAAKIDTAAIKVVTDRVNTGLVADGLVWQFTANMLELGPSGGGGGGGAGTGARTITVTVTDDSATPLQNATVRFTEGANTFVASTNSSGVKEFNLDDATYTVAITKDGFEYFGGTLVVSADAPVTYVMTRNTPIPVVQGHIARRAIPVTVMDRTT